MRGGWRHGSVLALTTCLALGSACGDEPATGGAGGDAGGSGGNGGASGGAGAGRDGPWGPSWDCEPGSLPQDDGTCLAAGIAPALCGAYFASDGDQSCEPVLPTESCPAGTMALPGEDSCHAVSVCGAPPFGNVPTEADTVYVNQASAPGGDGSSSTPFQTIGEAVASAPDGAIVAIAAGTYAEPVSITGKRVRIWGACPDEVHLDGADETAIAIASDATGSEVHGLSVTGSFDAIEVEADGVLLEGLRIHDSQRGVSGIHLTGATLAIRNSLIESYANYGIWTLGIGLDVQDVVIRDGTSVNIGMGIQASGSGTAGAIAVSLSRVLVDRPRSRGISVDGAALTLRDVVVRDVAATGSAGGLDGGIVTAPTFGAAASIDAERVVIERAGASGLTLLDTGGSLVAVAVRDNDPSQNDATEQSGDGLIVYNVGLGAQEGVSLAVRSCTFDRVRSSGVYIEGSTVSLEAVRVRDVRPYHVDQSLGTGIVAAPAFLSETHPAELTVAGSLVERVYEGGILTLGAAVTITNTRVADVTQRALGGLGRCVAFEHEALLPPATATVRSSLVEGCEELGIGTLGVDTRVENTLVRNVTEGAAPQGACLLAQFHPLNLRAATMTVTDSAVESCAGFGVFAGGASASLSRTSVVGASPYADSSFGDGVAAVSATSFAPQLSASLTLSDTLIADSGRAGVALFGVGATFENRMVLDCNTIHLNGETYEDDPASIDAPGDVRCSCMQQIDECKLLSQSLEAPDPI